MTDRYLAARRAAGYTAYLTLRALGPLLGYLRRLGVAPEPVRPGPATAAEVLQEEYRAWLLGERGVTPAVARGYLDLVRPFAERRAADGGAGLGALTAGDVTAFLTAQSRRLAPKTAQRLATALRSLLRFWHLQGLICGPLDRAVPKVANRRPGLPRPLEPGQVRAMLDACDRAAAAGRRDLAMLTLMARMGLRAGEVAGLRLDDISWRAGEITVRGKGNRRDQLPLPPDAGGAMAAWLRDGRPATALDRAVFTRIKAPHQGLTSGGVTMAVAAAAGRAGLGTIYAHRLRHSAATAMLAEGGPDRDRPGAAAPPADDHRDLRQGRHRGAARAGAPVAGSGVMTGLRQALAGYLDLRRGLGFKLARDEKLLEQYITWLEDRGTTTVTVADALAWATLPAGASRGWLRMRITVVRGFAAYLATLDPSAEVPPASLLPGGSHRAVPYLYSAADIAALMAQATGCGRRCVPRRCRP